MIAGYCLESMPLLGEILLLLFRTWKALGDK
uniref:Uncharacterized protein n=1 Tax=Rhizophora mucronata TaxID=61149 RepID=A0A2P2P6X0_RHIMU